MRVMGMGSLLDFTYIHSWDHGTVRDALEYEGVDVSSLTNPLKVVVENDQGFKYGSITVALDDPAPVAVARVAIIVLSSLFSTRQEREKAAYYLYAVGAVDAEKKRYLFYRSCLAAATAHFAIQFSSEVEQLGRMWKEEETVDWNVSGAFALTSPDDVSRAVKSSLQRGLDELREELRRIVAAFERNHRVARLKERIENIIDLSTVEATREERLKWRAYEAALAEATPGERLRILREMLPVEVAWIVMLPNDGPGLGKHAPPKRRLDLVVGGELDDPPDVVLRADRVLAFGPWPLVVKLYNDMRVGPSAPDFGFGGEMV